MNAIAEMLRAERRENSPCKVTLTLRATGQFVARMSFAPGMETAEGVATSVEGALAALNNTLARVQGGAA